MKYYHCTNYYIHNIKEHVLVIACVLALSCHSTINAQSYSLKESMLIASIVTCLAGTVYGFYAIMYYFFYPKKIQCLKTQCMVTQRTDLNKKQIYAIKVSSKMNIYFIQAPNDEEHISLTADKDSINNLEIKTDTENHLIIGPKQKSLIKNAETIICTIALKTICHVKLCGMINAYFATDIKDNELHLKLKDKAQISLQKNCSLHLDFLTATCSRSSSVNLKGLVDRQQIYLSDSAYYDAKNLKTHYTHLEAHGSGEIKINVEEEQGIYGINKGQLTGFITDKRKLEYKGNLDLSIFQRKDFAIISYIEQ